MPRGTGTGFAAALKSLRERKGWSQRELAEVSGVTLGGVTKLEQGTREPNWPTVLKLASALGVTVLDFLPKKRKDGRT